MANRAADRRSTRIDVALRAWSTSDRDNPFPLFAEVRELGPVHQVTLADQPFCGPTSTFPNRRRAQRAA